MRVHERTARYGRLSPTWADEPSACHGPEPLALSPADAALAVRVIRSGEPCHVGLTFARRAAAYRADQVSTVPPVARPNYVERGPAVDVVTCPTCGTGQTFDNYRDALAARGLPCTRCAPSPEPANGPNVGRMSPDTYSVKRGRNRKGATSNRVIGRADWSVTGSPVLRVSDLSTDNVATLGEIGLSPAAWAETWSAHLSGLRRRADGSFSGSSVTRAADQYLRRDIDVPGGILSIPGRVGSANGLSWEQVLRLPPTSAAWARHTVGLSGGSDDGPDYNVVAVRARRGGSNVARWDAWPNVPRWVAVVEPGPWDRTLVASADGRFYVIDRSTLDVLASGPVRPPVSKLSPADEPSRRGYANRSGLWQPPNMVPRDSERAEWAEPLRFGPLTIHYLPGPIVGDERAHVGCSTISRGPLARPSAARSDAARATVSGQRVRTVRLARTVLHLGPSGDGPAPDTAGAWAIVGDAMQPGDRVTFDHLNGTGTITRGATGRWSARVLWRDGTGNRWPGIRTADTLGATLAHALA